MKVIVSKLALSFVGLLIVLCICCRAKDQQATDTTDNPTATQTKQAQTKPNAVEPKPKQQSVTKSLGEPLNPVAKIGDYFITKDELEKRLMKELRPNPYEHHKEDEVVDANTVLLEMIAEKAMIIEARKQNYLEDKDIQTSLKRFAEGKLVNLLLARHMEGKIIVTEAEIDEKIKSDPKLDRTRARMMLEREKANTVLDQYYSELYKKFNIQKVSVNFPIAARIHQRLLYYPQKPREAGFIRIRQIDEEITVAEKEIILAKFDGGKITLKDWFDTLCDMAPPRRPGDLGTPKGVEQLLERALRKPIFVLEAKLNGLDKDKSFLRQLKEQEDGMLLNKARQEKIKDIKGPIPKEQIVAYFERNKEIFGTEQKIKIDQIWCQDLETARKAKAQLDNGKDFESVRKEYSFDKQGKAFDTSPSSEGMFFKDLWQGDPNEIVGPVKGFYGNAVKWRIVKVLEKKPGELKDYSSDMKNRVETTILEEQRDATLGKYRKQLLKTYSYNIYAEIIKDIDPLNIR